MRFLSSAKPDYFCDAKLLYGDITFTKIYRFQIRSSPIRSRDYSLDILRYQVTLRYGHLAAFDEYLIVPLWKARSAFSQWEFWLEYVAPTKIRTMAIPNPRKRTKKVRYRRCKHGNIKDVWLYFLSVICIAQHVV